MSYVIGWYLVVSIIGLLVWPLVFRLVPGLSDRGYFFSRAFGLIFVGFIFWLLCSLGFLFNTIGGILASVLIAFALAITIYRTRPDREDTLWQRLTESRSAVITTEVLFLVGFVSWVLFRAYNPGLYGTEKPMELAFLNGVRQSAVFPPKDPWLSGFAISYYYFGYVIMAMIAELTNTPTGIAFNLGIALLFALTLVGSYGIVHNLISAQNRTDRASPIGALLGPLFVCVVGNLEGFLELIRALKLPFLGVGFWQWLDIEDLTDPASGILWPPERWRFWWWWRASRVVRDRDVMGNAIGLQPIDEFPFFSFLLGDMHPHVLALPFVMVALGLALNALLQRSPLTTLQKILYAICFGALAFLNAWDLPIYTFIVGVALLLRARRTSDHFSASTLIEPITTTFTIFIGGILAYLPWYISFSSQAGGILPNAIFPTRFQQFVVMFGLFLLVIVILIIVQMWRRGVSPNWAFAGYLTLGLLCALVISTSILSWIALKVDPSATQFAASATGASDLRSIISAIIRYRVSQPVTSVFLLVLIFAAVALMVGSRKTNSSEIEQHNGPPVAFTFVLILIVTGALLTIGPEFVYLRDVFGQRLNTVFKFYYATWVLWSIASAYGAYLLLSSLKIPVLRFGFATILIVVTAMYLVYPALAIPAKAEGFNKPPTLDGLHYIQEQNPDDYAAIVWLQQNANPDSIILEAVGGSYTYFGRFSSSTGLQTLMGWPGHESQWRGSLFASLAGNRESVVQEIYSTNNLQHARDLLQQFNVTYVIVGSLERDPSYAPTTGLDKFEQYFPAVFRQGGTVIYQVDSVKGINEP